MMRSKVVNNSEFTMWRAIFAFALSDRYLAIEEQQWLFDYMSAVPFSRDQLNLLRKDFRLPQDVETLFNAIENPAHKKRFCELARMLVWSKGDMDLQEKIILRKLSCFSKDPHKTMLHESRESELLRRYHDSYEKTILYGQPSALTIVEIRA